LSNIIVKKMLVKLNRQVRVSALDRLLKKLIIRHYTSLRAKCPPLADPPRRKAIYKLSLEPLPPRNPKSVLDNSAEGFSFFTGDFFALASKIRRKRDCLLNGGSHNFTSSMV
jgi:hypothetical protein